MLVRGATLALVSCVVTLAACSEQGARACATQVAPAVCETPGSLRGAEAVPVIWGAEPQIELAPEPLSDGRYVQTGRSLGCGEAFSPPAQPPSVTGVLEVSGCVLRRAFVTAPGAAPQVTVATFDYGSDGSLALKDACSSAPAASVTARYGFDGMTLQLSVSSEETSADGTSYSCSGVDTYEPL